MEAVVLVIVVLILFCCSTSQFPLFFRIFKNINSKEMMAIPATVEIMIIPIVNEDSSQLDIIRIRKSLNEKKRKKENSKIFIKEF